MLGRKTKLGVRVECLAGVSGRAGASNEVEFPREIPACRPKIEKTLCLADIYHPRLEARLRLRSRKLHFRDHHGRFDLRLPFPPALRC